MAFVKHGVCICVSVFVCLSSVRHCSSVRVGLGVGVDVGVGVGVGVWVCIASRYA